MAFYTLIPLLPTARGRKHRMRKDKLEEDDDERLARTPRGRRERRQDDKQRRRHERLPR